MSKRTARSRATRKPGKSKAPSLQRRLDEALAQQTATAEILGVIASSPTEVQPVFDVIVERAVRLCGARFGRVYRYDGSTIHLVASFGLSASGLGLMQRVFPRPAADDTIVGRVILSRQPYFIEDVERDDTVPALPRQMIKALSTRSQVTVPMLRAGEPIGAITMGWELPGAFDDQQVALLRTFADQAVIAIENVRLFNETREALERQTAMAEVLQVISASMADTAPVFDKILQSCKKLFSSAEHGILLVAEDGRVRIAAHHGSAGDRVTELVAAGLADGLVQVEAIRRRKPLHFVNALAEEARGPVQRVAQRLGIGPYSQVVAPMLWEDRPVGWLYAIRQPATGFKEAEIALLKTFADQAVIAIQNSRLFNETKEALEKQTATADILQVLSGSPSDTQPVFDAIVRHAARLCESSYANVFRYDGDQIHLAASEGVADEALRALRASYPSRPNRSRVIGRVVETMRVVHVEDTLADPEYDQSFAGKLRLRRLLGVPLLRGARPVGAITVGWAEAGPIQPRHEDLLRTFADQAVIAIENVRLFNETKESLEQQTAISEVLRVISSSPADVQPVLEAVAERAARICDAKDARIFLVDGQELRYAAGQGDVRMGEIGMTRPLERGLVMGRAVIDREPVQVEDLERAGEEFPLGRQAHLQHGHRTALAVPLLRERKALGAILLRRMEVRPFSDKQIALLKTFADQAAIAIENVRLFNETKEALERQTATAEVLRVISGSPTDAQPVFDAIVKSCFSLFKVGRVTLWIVKGNQVRVRARMSASAEKAGAYSKTPLDRSSGVGRCVLDARMIHVPDMLQVTDELPRAKELGLSLDYRAALFAPLVREGRALGVISLLRPQPGPFSDKEVALLQTFADQAIIAIENVRLFREIQEKSAQLETANKHKSEFLANMSHELRTPLNAIIGFSEALMERMFGELSEKQADYLKDIHESGKHLLSLINDILDLSKIEAGRMELDVSSFDLPTALGNAMTLIRERAQRHGIALELEVDQALGEFRGDERKFKQIMLNLLSNAVKFTPDGGRVVVSAKKDTTCVEIAVRDTGIGIAPEDQGLVFEEFQQVGRDHMKKAEGTGLGLALTKRFVELHGGAIRLESTPGKGSTFSFSLPFER